MAASVSKSVFLVFVLARMASASGGAHIAHDEKKPKAGLVAPTAVPVQPPQSAVDLKELLSFVNREITLARSVCKPYKGPVGPHDVDEGCVEAFAKAEKAFNSLPKEAQFAVDYQAVAPRFRELESMKEEKLRRAREWDELAAKKELGKPEPFEKLKVLFPISEEAYTNYENPDCGFASSTSFFDSMEQIRAIRASPKMTRFCKSIGSKKRPEVEQLYCRIHKSDAAKDSEVFSKCLRKHVADWAHRRIQSDLRALERGQFLTEDRARKTSQSLEKAIEERLSPWARAAERLHLSLEDSEGLEKAKEKQAAFARAFQLAAEKECVAPTEVSAMDARAPELAGLLTREGAKLLKAYVARKTVFEENGLREVTGKYQKAYAVYSRPGDKYCWVASATYHAKHLGSDKWAPWGLTYDGTWLDANGKWASVLPCRCK